MIKDLSKLSELDFSYLSGLLERATFTISSSGNSTPNSFTYRITLAYSDPIFVAWLIENIGGRNIPNQGRDRWVIRGKESMALMARCAKYLRTKRQQANIYLLFGTTIKTKPQRTIRGTYVFYSAEEMEYRHKLSNLLKDENLTTPQGKYRPQRMNSMIKNIIDSKPHNSSGLFDFFDPSDGYGEVLVYNPGFFDEFIESLQD